MWSWAALAVGWGIVLGAVRGLGWNWEHWTICVLFVISMVTHYAARRLRVRR